MPGAYSGLGFHVVSPDGYKRWVLAEAPAGLVWCRSTTVLGLGGADGSLPFFSPTPVHSAARRTMNREATLGAITAHVRTRKGRERRSDRNEVWIDHLCLFHDDRERSATWQPDTGVYHCYADSQTYSLQEVAARLGIRPDDSVAVQPVPVFLAPPTKVIQSETYYDYVHPDGTFSHRHRRIDYEDGSKDMPFVDRTGKALPASQHTWPLYDETQLVPNQVVMVVEGEKCVDYVNLADDAFSGVPIRAISAGSAAYMKKYSPEITTRLGELTPAAILVWPDNDPAGMDWARALRSELDRNHLPSLLIDPMRYNLGPHEDVANYLEQGGALAVVVNDYWQQVTLTANGSTKNSTRMNDLIATTIVLNPAQFIFPGTQNPTKLASENLESAWLQQYNVLPPAQIVKELRGRLMVKGHTDPTDVAFRLFAAENAFWWRPNPESPCYQVSINGIEQVPDPPKTLVLVPRSKPLFRTEVDLDGDVNDFYRFCKAFRLDDVQEGIALTWLVSAFTGRKTPILLLKGGSSTGKTTLASYLAALVDPDVPTLAATQVERDVREFIRTAQRHPALLLDNVSKVAGDVEDALSKLVTGETAALRTLYEDVIETIHLQRAVLVTTTTWDVTKGDLASRMWPIEPSLSGKFKDEEEVHALFNPLLPRLRGFVFKSCVAYYQKSKNYSGSDTSLRIGGRVLQALGYDVEAVSKYIQAVRARVISEGEPWLDAIVDLWAQIEKEGPFVWTPVELGQFMFQRTGDMISAKGLASFIRPRQALFPNYGFEVTWGRDANTRFYKFRSTRVGEETDENL